MEIILINILPHVVKHIPHISDLYVLFRISRGIRRSLQSLCDIEVCGDIPLDQIFSIIPHANTLHKKRFLEEVKTYPSLQKLNCHTCPTSIHRRFPNLSHLNVTNKDALFFTEILLLSKLETLYLHTAGDGSENPIFLSRECPLLKHFTIGRLFQPLVIEQEEMSGLWLAVSHKPVEISLKRCGKLYMEHSPPRGKLVCDEIGKFDMYMRVFPDFSIEVKHVKNLWFCASENVDCRIADIDVLRCADTKVLDRFLPMVKNLFYRGNIFINEVNPLLERIGLYPFYTFHTFKVKSLGSIVVFIDHEVDEKTTFALEGVSKIVFVRQVSVEMKTHLRSLLKIPVVFEKDDPDFIWYLDNK